MKNIAVILASGTGFRMGLDIPKQFLKISGKPIVEHTLQTFNNNRSIDEIIIMITPNFVDQIKPIAEKFPKVVTILEGGSTRNETSKMALEYIGEECNVIFHDAVRPFVSDRIINDCVDALNKFNAVDVAIESADTIIKIDEEDLITDIPDRSRLRRGQTPQAFKWSTIKKAYSIAADDDNFKATDDCGVVLKYIPNEKIFVVKGDDSNMKVTYPLDATIADKLFQLYTLTTGSFTDDERSSYLTGKVVVVFGGSYGIGASIADEARKYGAAVSVFSRKLTGTDVANKEDVKKALSSVNDEHGKIDIVINTAGQLSIGELSSMDDEDIDNLAKVNYVGPIFIAKYSKPYLAKTGGQLLMFTSSSYTRGRASYSVYSSSKAGVVNLTQALAEEWADQGVSINCMNPERTATPMRQNAFGEEDRNSLLDASIVALASIDAIISNVTGQVFDVRLR